MAKVTSETKEAGTFKFTKKRAVTLELLKPQIDKPVYVKFTCPIYQAKETRSEDQIKKDAGQNEPPMLANIVNLENNKEQQIIIPSVLESELTDAYPEDAYVGLSFELVKFKKKEGKRYHPFSIIEIEAS